MSFIPADSGLVVAILFLKLQVRAPLVQIPSVESTLGSEEDDDPITSRFRCPIDRHDFAKEVANLTALGQRIAFWQWS